MLLILDERSLTIMLFKINKESFNFREHGAESRDLNNCLLIRSFSTKVMLNENYERICSCSSTRIEIRFTMYFIMSDDRLIINLWLRLIVTFDLFRDERDNFEFEKNSSLKFESKSF